MAREVRVIQVRLKSILDIPLITLPFLGDVPPRKLIYGVALALIAYALTYTLSTPYIMVAVIIGFSVGYLIAKEPKAVSWEKQLYYLVTGKYRPSLRRTLKYHRVKSIREEVSRIVLTDLTEPVKIYGAVYDEYTGAPLSTELTLIVDGREASRTVSDPNGRYIFYVHLRPGMHDIEVRAGDQVLIKRKVSVIIMSEHHR